MQHTVFTPPPSRYIAITSHHARGPTDVAQMLEIGKESEKMKAMKGIIEEIAKGLDQSQYFPNVVKLVVSKSLEVSQ